MTGLQMKTNSEHHEKTTITNKSQIKKLSHSNNRGTQNNPQIRRKMSRRKTRPKNKIYKTCPMCRGRSNQGDKTIQRSYIQR